MSHLLSVELHAEVEMLNRLSLLRSDGHRTTDLVVDALPSGEGGTHTRTDEQLWPLLLLPKLALSDEMSDSKLSPQSSEQLSAAAKLFITLQNL